MQAPIFVTGSPRSGLTMTATILNRCGAFVCQRYLRGKGTIPRSGSPIADQVLIPFLKLNGVDPRGQKPLPDINRLLKIDNLRTQVESIVKFSGYRHGVWIIKDHRLAITWPIWTTAFPDAQWVLVYRDPGEVVQSCLHTAYMNAYQSEEDWTSWISNYLARLTEIRSEVGSRAFTVIPGKFIKGETSEIRKTVENLGGLKWTPEVVEDFVNQQEVVNG